MLKRTSFPKSTITIGLLIVAMVCLAVSGRSQTAAANTGKEVVAYFAQWGVYGRDYHVKDIVTSGSAEKITIINYAFGHIKDGECIMTTQLGVMDAYADYQKSYSAAESVDGVADSWSQDLRGNFNQLKKLKAMYPHIRVLISLGGWTWSGDMSDAALTPQSRQQAVASCIDIYINGNLPVADGAGGLGAAAGVFDGIDIDWEYPATAGLPSNTYRPEDTENFTLLLEEFRTQLDAIDPNLMLTIATGAGVDKYELIELDQIHQHLDYINLMTYDFHGAWENTTNFHAPLYASNDDPATYPQSEYNIHSTVQGFLNGGVPAEKLIIGIPFYGRGWNGVTNSNNGLYQAAGGGAPATYEAEVEDYKVLKNFAGQTFRDPITRAFWKFDGNTFWSYDDEQVISEKMAYINANGLAGAMAWALDGDDSDGTLMSAIHDGLGNTTPPPPTPVPPTPTATADPNVIPTATTPPTGYTAPVWVNGTVYTGGDVVSHNGYEWRAKWWTNSDEPGTTGEYGVWEQLQPCGTPPTATPEPTSEPTTQPTSEPTTQPTNEPPTPTATTPVGGSCTSPQYVAGTSYATGDIVQNVGNEYQCTVGGWCSSSAAWAYEPGVGAHWQQAWSLVGACNVNPTPTSEPTAEPTIQPTTEPTVGPTTQPTIEPTTEPTVQPTPTTQPTPSPTSQPPTGHAACRPAGLYTTAGVDVPYCTVYDGDGREDLDVNHNRRVIGYFTSWRDGSNGQPAYLASDIPWDKVTHINYAFAHIDDNNQVSVGQEYPGNSATDMTWPGVAGAEMDPEFAYNGHFNLLSKYKKQHPHVKTLISIGGWAETGGYFDANGDRVDNGGFYTMTTNPDGSVNTAGINAFSASAVNFIRTYGFDGVDIDYEYPTSMQMSGNPLDFAYADSMRGDLMQSYVVLMRTLREKLDIASEQDGQHYMLTIAAPSSGYLLRGMETFQVTQYLDYVNIMTYDLHGAWNQYVGHNAALFDTGEDAELAAANVYGTAQYGGLGYLNTDWAYHYFRGSMPSGRINIGIPYYTRGWQAVEGGTNGLWGTASLPSQDECPDGTGIGTSLCGYGAVGIDNLWHDLDQNEEELGAGSNPMWHAKNLENGIVGSYLSSYGLDPNGNPDHALTGTYNRFYDAGAEAAWLWNDDKDVFLSIEDEQSMAAKVQYVIDNEIGGVMFWELAGDYDYDSANGEYFMGDTLTSVASAMFANATPYGIQMSNRPIPPTAVDLSVEITSFKIGDQNYPINPKIRITNNTGAMLAGGTTFEFDIPTSAPDNAKDQSGAGLTVIESGHSGNNIGGLTGDFHRVAFSLPSWQTLADGETFELDFVYYLPISGPSNYTVAINGTTYALSSEHPDLPLADLSSGGGGGGGTSCADAGIDPSIVNEYPNWTAGDHANGNDLMQHNGEVYRAKWWTNSMPGSDDSWEFVCSVGSSSQAAAALAPTVVALRGRGSAETDLPLLFGLLGALLCGTAIVVQRER